MSDETRDQVLELARDVIRRDALAAESIAGQLGDEFLAAVELLARCRGKVFVTGMGTSGAVARRLAHMLSCTGTPSVFIHAGDGLHGGLGAVTAGDVLVALSRGGESDELNEFVRRARVRGAAVVVVTGVRTSPLAQAADIVLETLTPPEAEPGGRLAMGSSLAACVLGDALAIALMNVRGYAWQSFDFTHPAGAVGKAKS